MAEYKNTLEEIENAKINPFIKKESRADLIYVPKCCDLKDVTYFGDLSTKDGRDLLVKILDNKIK
jgi:hypothetical protein